MDKTYKSQTVLSIRTKSGYRVTFDEISEGKGSVYTTSNEDLQKEIEEHPLFNIRFKILSVSPSPEEEAKAKSKKEPAKTDDNAVREVDISDPGEAKDYLAEYFQVSRTRMRSKADILRCAEENKVKFIGL